MSDPAEVEPVGTRDRLLAAAETCLRRDGIRRTTMVEIANEAGVSRAGLYKHFPDKAALVVATLAHTDEAFWADATTKVAAADGLAARVATAVLIAVEHQPGALLLRLQDEEPDAFAATVGSGLKAMVPGMTPFWHPFIDEAKAAGEVRADLDTARAAEWVLRLVLSLVTIPGESVDLAEPASVHAFVDEFLLAGLR
ncbi:TetR/AcrR family transcriptional regulator [Aquihabitans sp. G128]|uniref:TetR/AcrR family transcriptional regulator n=1 Tax=Aquihabitans sp. G128 TaxID=2849779 RepID=UPI001C233A2C|nr:TetR/AcrR family transcriptional regulator [Aquihabitans sp. G128]QXC61639.1 TetR/AcrR family transcriptional regulator [Aquihabitans sp. G128]